MFKINQSEDKNIPVVITIDNSIENNATDNVILCLVESVQMCRQFS